MDNITIKNVIDITQTCKQHYKTIQTAPIWDHRLDDAIWGQAVFIAEHLNPNRVSSVQERMSLGASIAFINAWSQSKIIYDFHPSFLPVLADTEDTPLDLSILKSLPFKTFLMQSPLRQNQSLFVCIRECHEDNSVFLGVSELTNNPETGEEYEIKGIFTYLYQNTTIMDALQRSEYERNRAA